MIMLLAILLILCAPIVLKALVGTYCSSLSGESASFQHLVTIYFDTKAVVNFKKLNTARISNDHHEYS